MAPRKEIEEFRADLQKALRQQICESIRLKPLADLLAPILHCPRPELRDQLDRLWDYAREAPIPLAAVFAVHRHSSSRFNCQFWWLQMLVTISQGFGSRRRWIIPNDIDSKRQKVVSAIQAARNAWTNLVGGRGSAVLSDLVDALELLLDHMPRGLTLDGRYLWKDGARINKKLTPKQALFMRLLIESTGKPVSDREFKKQGIQRVDVLKTRFLGEPSFSFLDDHITSTGTGGFGYQLLHL